MNVDKWRNWALVMMFGGFFVMYSGVYHRAWIPYLMVIGGLGVLAGILVYFRFGPVNPTVHEAECPRCGRITRLTGAYDACRHCHQPMRRVPGGGYEPYVK
ncbi:DUF2614 family zinc ribbon-containing protein [Alicyclobacillus macrosporangiidus]|uniref:DUF2614 family zinc ribbon-containing protein n=1 Tax=Alicyclobacillus macrosporangiidus TaxID=392015 RepID=UPI00049640B9|nr:DUF2614 family zinc ribbon-containing protein [Alicyclobacillus macrosporangiidus]